MIYNINNEELYNKIKEYIRNIKDKNRWLDSYKYYDQMILYFCDI